MSERLRIAVDACPLVKRRTGVGNYVYTLLNALCEGHPEAEFYLYSNNDIHFPPHANVTLRPRCGRTRGLFWQNLELPRRMRADGIDVYWGTNGFVPVVGRRRIPAVVTIHGLAERFAPETMQPLVRWSRRLMHPASARAARYLVCASGATAADMARLYGVTARAVVHPPIAARFRRPDAAEIARVRTAHALPDRFLLAVGTLEPRKNIARLVAAALSLREAGVPVPLIVHAGGGGWLRNQSKDVMAAGERAGVVHRLGFVPSEDLPGLYGASMAFIMPSLYEGFGMPVLEAQLCGAPVLHGDHASMVEAGGGLGIAFPPTAEGIAAILRELAAARCPLVCRLPGDIVNDPRIGAEVMWAALVDAVGEGAP